MHGILWPDGGGSIASREFWNEGYVGSSFVLLFGVDGNDVRYSNMSVCVETCGSTSSLVRVLTPQIVNIPELVCSQIHPPKGISSDDVCVQSRELLV